MLDWGEMIRRRFIMDNLTQFKSATILENLPEEEIASRFVGANSFGDSLVKLMSGYRGLMSETQQLRGIVLKLSDSIANLQLTIETMRSSMGQMHITAVNSNATNLQVNSQQNISSLPIPMQLNQARAWPLKSMAGMALSDLIYQFVSERLDLIPTEINNKVQSEALRALAIAAQFEPQLNNLKSQFGGSHPKPCELEKWVELAESAERKVLEALELKKKSIEVPDGKKRRQRKHTGFVPAIVRSWSSQAKADSTVAYI